MVVVLVGENVLCCWVTHQSEVGMYKCIVFDATAGFSFFLEGGDPTDTCFL